MRTTEQARTDAGHRPVAYCGAPDDHAPHIFAGYYCHGESPGEVIAPGLD